MLVFRSLIQRLTPQGAAAYDPETRARLWLFAGWTSVAVNIVLALLKAVMAFLTGSVSLAADALHSFSDLLTSAVVIIGFRIGKKPADKRHPFGHGRMETISALIVCMDSPFFDDTPAPQQQCSSRAGPLPGASFPPFYSLLHYAAKRFHQYLYITLRILKGLRGCSKILAKSQNWFSRPRRRRAGKPATNPSPT